MSDERSHLIAALAERFRDYLTSQTDTDMTQIEAVDDPHGLDVVQAFERLDAALSVLVDLASVYDDMPRSTLESLVLPAAALAGEYLRVAGFAEWYPLEEGDPDDDLTIVAGSSAIELTGVVRAALAGERPNLSAVAQRIVELTADP